MSLVRNGRARLALALPHHRERLRHTKSRELDDLYEEYAVAAEMLERLQKETPRREELIAEYEGLCLSIQAAVVELLERPITPT
jgi:CRISPR/Cas system-associated endonuclease Cas3-HD